MNIKMIWNLEMPMRDGVILRGDLYRPDDDRAYPSVVWRTCYEKDIFEREWGQLSPIALAKAGYNVLIQDIRGCGYSDGELNYYKNEAEDGYDTVEWLAEQPWCDGNVGMYGHSNPAYYALSTAELQPPHLRCICPFMQLSTAKFSGGFLPNMMHAGWLVMQTGRYIERLKRIAPERYEKAKATFDAHTKDLGKQYWHLPEVDMPAMQMTEEFPFLAEYRQKVEGYDDPAVTKVEGRPLDLSRFKVPALMYCGLYDMTSKEGPIDNFIKLTTGNNHAGVQQGTRLVIGPWDHTRIYSGNQGALKFPGVEGNEIGVWKHILRFFDRWLKGIDNGIDGEAPIHLYCMGENRWRDESEWPLRRTRYTDFYFHSDGNAKVGFDNGVLRQFAPDALEPADAYTYDPANPTPAFPVDGAAGQTKDYRSVEAREDVLVYNTAVLEDDIEVTGPVHAELHVSSSAPDTDFVCRLIDVYPDGRAINITFGCVRARYNNTYEAKLLRAGEIRKLDCFVGNTSILFRKGHKIRLEVASACFPYIDRNHNTGNRIGTDCEMRIAENRVHHDAAHASKLILPVIPR